MQLVGNRSLDGYPAHFRAPPVGCARCRRHETGPSTTFSPGPSTIPRISRKPQAVYLRFYFCPRRHGHGCRPNVVDGPHPWREVPGGRRPGAGKEGGGVATARGARPRGRKGHRGASRPVPAPASAAGLRPLAAARKIFSEIALASPSEFPYSTSSHGGVAQLGERLTGSQEVRGSIPLVSTRALNEAPTQVGAFFHIGTQGQSRHHDPPGRQDHALNGCRVHGSISRRGSKRWKLFFQPNRDSYLLRALGATVSAGDS